MIIKAILKTIVIWLILLTGIAIAEEKNADADVKKLSGISIIGNKEAPKSLFIVPWKNSEVGVTISLNAGVRDDGMRSLDKEVFFRELNFYELSHGIK